MDTLKAVIALICLAAILAAGAVVAMHRMAQITDPDVLTLRGM